LGRFSDGRFKGEVVPIDGKALKGNHKGLKAEVATLFKSVKAERTWLSNTEQ
jgi:hypothetical protein